MTPCNGTGTFTLNCDGWSACKAVEVYAIDYEYRYSVSFIVICSMLTVHVVLCPLSSVDVACNGSFACLNTQMYCPETAGCSIHCDPDSLSPCDGADLYISDPDKSYNESLLSISCESNDCAIFKYLCVDIGALNCTQSTVLNLTALDCTSDSDHCLVCTYLFGSFTSQTIMLCVYSDHDHSFSD